MWPATVLINLFLTAGSQMLVKLMDLFLHVIKMKKKKTPTSLLILLRLLCYEVFFKQYFSFFLITCERACINKKKKK